MVRGGQALPSHSMPHMTHERICPISPLSSPVPLPPSISCGLISSSASLDSKTRATQTGGPGPLFRWLPGSMSSG